MSNGTSDKRSLQERLRHRATPRIDMPVDMQLQALLNEAADALASASSTQAPSGYDSRLAHVEALIEMDKKRGEYNGLHHSFRDTLLELFALQAQRSAIAAPVERAVDSGDPFCPKCGHNRDKSSVSTIDLGENRSQCQMCSATWREIEAAPVTETRETKK